MVPYSAIAFDLDDTLYPERDYVLSGFRAVAEWAEQTLGIPTQEGFQVLADLFQVGVRGDTFNRWLKSYERPEEPWLKEMIEVYREHDPDLHPYEDVIPGLLELQHDHALGVITEGVQKVQEKKLKALNLPFDFICVIITDISERDLWKPSRVPFERFQFESKIPAKHTWYVGDNPEKDFRGAKVMGISTVRLRRSDGLHRNKEPLELKDAPDHEILTLSQLPQLIQGINTEV
jgi:putative hydrolase of the HAD superfamily